MASYGEVGKLAGAVMKKLKPTVKIGIQVDTPPISMSGGKQHDWRAEELKRCKAEIGALEKELKDFNPTEAANKVKKSIEIKLELKKLRLKEHELNLNDGLGGY